MLHIVKIGFLKSLAIIKQMSPGHDYCVHKSTWKKGSFIQDDNFFWLLYIFEDIIYLKEQSGAPDLLIFDTYNYDTSVSNVTDIKGKLLTNTVLL